MKKLFTISALLMCAFASPAFSQGNYPDRPIRQIVAAAAGTGVDLVARFFCDELHKELGQPCLVENKPGANSLIGIAAAKQAPADGYTVILGSNSPMAVNTAVVKDLPYDPVKEFKPIYGFARHTNVIIVGDNSKIKTVADLVAAAKKGDRQLNSGVYAAFYELGTAWLSNTIGAKFVQVRYTGLTQVAVDVIRGDVDFAIVDLAAAAPQLAPGQLRALATLGSERHPNFPNVPTVNETLPGISNYSWTGLYVRSEVPDEIARRLSDAMAKIMATPAPAAFVNKLNLELLPFGPEQMRKFQIEEIQRFGQIAAQAGIQKQ
jgi:tripartite-type tricarboxylate transporter receptor subunit TctC